MKRMLSTLFLAVTIINTSATAFAVRPANSTGDAHVWRAYAKRIPIGSTLAIRTTSGERLTAVLFVVDDTAMTVKPKTRVPEPARRIAFDDVDELSLRQNRVSIAKYVGIGAAAGAGVFLWFLTAALAGS